MDLQTFKDKVWAEGAAHYRQLPWRHIDDAYGVLVSEVMLQQTQVSRVDGRWQRWMEKFPTVEALAAASLSDVLSEWQGMGYNSRARRLQECARTISQEYGGVVPRDYKELLALPGIGPATAAGIRAFAFCDPGVYLETNVRAVFIHELFPEADEVGDKELIPLVEQACPETGPEVRDWYYALLDYGAYLKKVVPNPSRRSKSYSRQSKFEGSHRQKRAFLLRQLLAGEGTAEALSAELSRFEIEAGRDACDALPILEELAADGLALCSNGVWRCP